MDIIKKWFEEDDENYIITEYGSNLEAKTDSVIYLISTPDGTMNNKWVLRVSTISAFNRWADSAAIARYFDSEIDIYNYLVKNQLKIYKELIKYLSNEYNEIEFSFNEKNGGCEHDD